MVFLGFLQGLQKFFEITVIRLLARVARLVITIILLLIGLSVAGVMLGWAGF
ncbi:MAG: hypothetical protein QXK39_00745 [Nitrososphaerota archaeon]